MGDPDRRSGVALSNAQDALLQSAPGPVPADPDETVALLARVQSGDRAATDAFFTRYEDRIRRIVRVRLGAGLRVWTESGDLVQETCRAALRDLERIPRSQLEILDWLARIATNRIRDLADHLHAEKRDVDRVRPTRDLAADTATTPSGNAFRSEVRAILDQVVSELREDHREVVLLRDYHGAGWPEIARALKSPTVHAAQQLHQRAWIKIRQLAAPRLGGLEGG